MLKNEKIDQVNAKIAAYLTMALKDFHGQQHGIRVISIETSKGELNPPGYEYTMKIKAQVTLDTQKETPN